VSTLPGEARAQDPSFEGDDAHASGSGSDADEERGGDRNSSRTDDESDEEGWKISKPLSIKTRRASKGKPRGPRRPARGADTRADGDDAVRSPPLAKKCWVSYPPYPVKPLFVFRC